MIVEKMMIAIASEKTRKPSSLAHDLSVLPSIRRPAECRENLNILQQQQQQQQQQRIAPTCISKVT